MASRTRSSTVTVAAVSTLPPLYARWMDQLLQGPIPDESRATCEACAMCWVEPAAVEREADRGPALRFDPATKCCTFLPAIPGFLVGGILRDEDPEGGAGRASVRARLAAGVGVTPRGLGRTPTFSLLYGHGPGAFGRSRALRCPHFLDEGGGRCGIWRHREATCATWFCKHRRGSVGMAFWRRGVQPLLEAVEAALGLHCALVLGLEDRAVDWLLVPPPATDEPLDAAAIDGRVDPERRRAAWGRWAGRDEEYFIACAELVEAMAWKEVAAIAGAEVALRARLVRALYRELLDEELPDEPLATARVEMESAGAGHVRLYTYSPYDGLRVPRSVVAALARTDGRAVEEVAAALRAALLAEPPTARDRDPAVATDPDGDAGATELLRALCDFEVLVPASSLRRRPPSRAG